MTCKSLQRTWTRTVGSANVTVRDVLFPVWVSVVCLRLCLFCACICIVFVFLFVFFSCVRVYCICAFIFVSQSLDAWPSVPKCTFEVVSMYVHTNVCLPHSCICTFQIMTAHLGVFAHASRQTIRRHSHTHKGKHTRAHVFRAHTHTHTSHHLLLLLRHFAPAAAAN